MKEPFLRPATVADLPVLESFQQGIVTAERPFDPTLRAGDVRYYDLAALVVSPAVHFLVAERDGEPVGCGFVRLDEAKSYLCHARQGYLGLMYVQPAHRGRGINGQILAELARWCREQGVLELRLEVYPANEAAVRAYAKAGFLPYMLQMRLGLTP